MRTSSTVKLSLVTLLVVAACSDSNTTATTVALKPTIIISSTTDPTSELIAEVYGQALEKAEFRIARKRPFANSGELLTAMADGKVQLAGMTTRSVLELLNSTAATTTSSTPRRHPRPPPWATPTPRRSKPRRSSKGCPQTS